MTKEIAIIITINISALIIAWFLNPVFIGYIYKILSKLLNQWFI